MTNRTNHTTGDLEVQLGYATSDVSDTSQMISFLAVTDDSGIRSGYGDPRVKKWSSQALAGPDPENEKAR